MGAILAHQSTPSYYPPTNAPRFTNHNHAPTTDPTLIRTLPPGQAFSSPSFVVSDPYAGRSAVQLQANAASLITGGRSGPSLYSSVKSSASLVGKAFKNVNARSLRRLGWLSPVAGVAGAASLPGETVEAYHAIGKAFRTGKGSDIHQAVGKSAGVVGSTAGVIKAPLEAAKWVHDTQTGRAAKAAFQKAAPKASKQVVKAAAKAAAKQALAETAENQAGKAITKAARKAAQSGGRTLAKSVTGTAGKVAKKAAKEVLETGGKAAAKAATKAAGKGLAKRALVKTAAKAGGRFVPGLNVAIAAADAIEMTATLADKNASTGKKVASVVTAAGSALAATNIPVVSQVGAAVSVVSSFLGSLF